MFEKQNTEYISDYKFISLIVIAIIAFGEVNNRQVLFSICSILLSLKNGIPIFR
jgi:hypothetical protein